MPPADDDFDIYGEDDGFGTVKEVDEVSFLSVSGDTEEVEHATDTLH